MQITIFGAAGKVGTLAVQEALRRGHTVVAFVHSHSPFSPSDQLIIRKGDIYNAGEVANALAGSHAVVSCLGSWGTPQRNVLSSAMNNIIPAMHTQNIPRIVTLTGIGVQQRPNRLIMRLLRVLGPLPAARVFRDAQEHLWLLAASDLVWTTICSPVMNNIDGPEYILSLRTGFPFATIARTSVAAALLDQVAATDYVRSTAVIHRK